MKKLLLLIITSLYTLNVMALDNALNIFNAQFLDKAEGIYSHQNITFLVTRQKCLKSKKYAGSQEAKVATARILFLFERYSAQQGLGVTLEDIPYQGKFKQVVFDRLVQEISHKSAVHRSNSKKIIDRDTGQCERLVVYALPSIIKSSRNETKINTEVEKSTRTVLNKMIKQRDTKLLSDWVSQLGFNELYMAIQPLKHGNISYVDNVKILSTFDSSQYYKKNLDRNLIVYQVLSGKALPLIDNVPKEYQSFASSLTLAAGQAFDKGENAKLIFRNLLLSLNLDPNQHEGWYLLGSLYRAFDKPIFSIRSQSHAIHLNPWIIDSWIELAKLAKTLKPEFKLKQFYIQLNKLPRDELSHWAIEQIKHSH